MPSIEIYNHARLGQALSQLEFITTIEDDPESLSVEQYVDGMAETIRTNIIGNLQGSWQRAAQHLIDGGILNWRGDVLRYPEEV